MATSSLKGKTYDEIYGPERAALRRERLRVAMTGHTLGETGREKCRQAAMRTNPGGVSFAEKWGKEKADRIRSKQSIALSGRRISEEHRRKLSRIKRRENLSVETLQRMREAQLARQCSSRFYSTRYQEWRLAVLGRDDWRCTECGREPVLAHHVRPWKDDPSLRFDPANGLALCKSCHGTLHAKEHNGRIGRNLTVS